MTVAEAVAPLIRAAVGPEAPVAIRGWDGSRTGPLNAQWAIKINNRRGLRRLLWAPNELGFARAYVSGDIEIEGNLLEGMAVLEQMSDPTRGPGVRTDADTKKAVVKAAMRLGIIGPPPKPPTEEAKLARGHRHDKRRDARAISHHYDVGNDFYRLVLGESMTYSCGYWAKPDKGLAAAQYAKCDLVARKLGLTPGMRVLDVGCGWGTFALHAARTYGVEVVGITLSHEQADYARAWVANLENNWDEAIKFSSAGRARIWRLYMAGSALGFTANRLGINQVLAVKSDEHGHSGIPATRTDLLRSRASKP